MNENQHEKLLKQMKEYIEKFEKLKKENPELAKKVAREQLYKAGIYDKDGKLAPPYNGQKVNENDFTLGPRNYREEDEER